MDMRDDKLYRYLDWCGEPIPPEWGALGWHYCPDWDEMLIGPDMKQEWDCCLCNLPVSSGADFLKIIQREKK